VVATVSHCQIEDLRYQPADSPLLFEWRGPSPRDYQVEAANAVITTSPPRGIVQVPIRGGKTLIAAMIIRQLGYRTLFIVESELLLRQTAAALESYLEPQSFAGERPWAGVCGGGGWTTSPVTVATIQGLLAHPQKAKELLAATDLLLIDEVHHLKGEEWRKPLLQADTWGKIGLSATVFENVDIPQERSTIWVRAATGPLLYEISIDRLIAEGHLVRPHILMYSITHENAPKKWRYGKTYNELIVHGLARNAAIADLAEDAALRGAPTLIDTGRTDQMEILHRMLEARHVPVAVLHGKTPGKKRQEVLADFRRGKIGVLIATILGEGVDVPELQVVINAEGGRARTSVMQRLRNLTRHDGKSTATVIDFADIGQKHLQQQALDRLNQYTGIASFQVHWVDQQSPYSIPDSFLGPKRVEVLTL